MIRARTKILVSLRRLRGHRQRARDAQPAARAEPVLKRAYIENADVTPRRPVGARHRADAASTACGRCTRWCRWICISPAARRRPISSTSSSASCVAGAHPGPPRPPRDTARGTRPAWASASSSTPSPASRGTPRSRILLDDQGEVSTPASTSSSSAASRSSAKGARSARCRGITARICGICPVSHMLDLRQGRRRAARPCEIPDGRGRAAAAVHYGQILQSHALSFFHLSSPDFLLGHRLRPREAQRDGPDRGEPRGRPARHPPAPVRPGGDRGPLGQEDPLHLGRAGRRRRAAHLGGPRPDRRRGCPRLEGARS